MADAPVMIETMAKKGPEAMPGRHEKARFELSGGVIGGG
jgi:hypothetical protein